MDFGRGPKWIGIALVLLAASGLLVGLSPGASGSGAAESNASATVDPTLFETEGTVTVIVEMESVDRSSHRPSDVTVSTLQDRARRAQDSLDEFAAERDGVAVERSFWIANAALVTVDSDRVSPRELAAVDGVEGVYENREFERPNAPGAGGPAPSTTDAAPASDALDQINASAAWNEYRTRGEGASVAVVSTGIDDEHPAFADFDADNWAQFDENGNRVERAPHDELGIGTGLAGAVVGDSESGPTVGVAPEAELYVGNVWPGATATHAQLLAGLEWAADQDVDAIVFSTGVDEYDERFIEPVRNAKAAGSVVVSSAEMDPGSGPGEVAGVYDSFAVGYTNESAMVPGDANGTEIDTAATWGSAAPADWPAAYVVPDVVAPDHGETTAPGGGYGYLLTETQSGVVAGTIALMESAAGGTLSPDEVESTLRDTAWKPSDANESGDDPDIRYGHGIIDAEAAVGAVASDAGANGTITDGTGTPIEGATVTLDGDPHAAELETGASGTYTLRAPEGEYTLSVAAFGYERETTTVSVSTGSLTTTDFELTDSLDVEAETGLPSPIEGGATVVATQRVANLDELVVDLGGSYDEAATTLRVNGTERTLGEPIPFDGYTGRLPVEIETGAYTAGNLELTGTLSGLGAETTRSFGTTTVHDEVTRVAVVDDRPDYTYAEWIARTLRAELSHPARVTHHTSAEATAAVDETDVFVVRHLDSARADEFVAATDRPAVGTVYLDQHRHVSNGVSQYHDVTGDPGTVATDSAVGFPVEAAPVYYEVEQSHEILAGYDPGDEIDVHEYNLANHVWFENTSFDVIATVGTQEDGTVGPALAVDESTNTVLAGSLGRTLNVRERHFTTASDRILANAVEHVEFDRASFSGSIDAGDRPAPTGSVLEAYVDGELRGREVIDAPGEYGGDDDPLPVEGVPADAGAPVTFTLDGLPVVETATWAEGAHTALDLTVSGNASIAGAVADGNGDSLPGVNVTGTLGVARFSDNSGPNGTYVIDGVLETEGELDVVFERRAYGSTETTIENVSGTITGVNATLMQATYYYGVDDLNAPAAVEEGDAVDVEATIGNFGSGTWNDTVTFQVEGAQTASRTVSLNGTDDATAIDTTTVTFTHTPNATGDVTYTTTTANETTSTTVTVEEAAGGGLPAPPPSDDEPALEIVDHALSTTEIEVGETVTVETTVANAGDAAGSTTLELTADGETADYASVDVDADDTAVAAFEHTVSEPGEYELAVDGEVVGTVTAVEPEEDDEEEADEETGGTDDATTGEDGISGFGVPVAVVALLSVALVARRRD